MRVSAERVAQEDDELDVPAHDQSGDLQIAAVGTRGEPLDLEPELILDEAAGRLGCDESLVPKRVDAGREEGQHFLLLAVVGDQCGPLHGLEASGPVGQAGQQAVTTTPLCGDEGGSTAKLRPSSRRGEEGCYGADRAAGSD